MKYIDVKVVDVLAMSCGEDREQELARNIVRRLELELRHWQDRTAAEQEELKQLENITDAQLATQEIEQELVRIAPGAREL